MRLINSDKYAEYADSDKYIVLDIQTLLDILKNFKTKKPVLITKDDIKKIRDTIDDLDRYFDNDPYSNNKDSMFKCDDVLTILNNFITKIEYYELKGE